MPILDQGLKSMWQALHLSSIAGKQLRALLPWAATEATDPGTLNRLRALASRGALFSMRTIGAPQKSYINNAVEAYENYLSQQAAKGLIDRPSEAIARSQLRAIREVVRMADAGAEARRLSLGNLSLHMDDLNRLHGLDSAREDLWSAVRREIDLSGGDISKIKSPAAQAVARVNLASMKAMAPHLTEKELLDQYRMLYPQIVDPQKISQIGEAVLANRLLATAQRIMASDRLRAVAQEELGRTNIDAEDVVGLLVSLVKAEGRGSAYSPVKGLMGSPARIVLRRAVSLPEEWRLHPYAEFLIGVSDEFGYAAEAGSIGRSGRMAHALLKWARGEATDIEILDMPQEYRKVVGTLDRLIPVGRYIERTGEVQRQLADMAEGLVRSYTGAYREDSLYWAMRTGLVPLGAITMMPFSAIPNMGQNVAEMIVRGFGSWMYGLRNLLRRGDATRTLHDLAVLAGQQQGALGASDLIHGVPNVNRMFTAIGGTKPLLSLFDPRWWGAHAQLIQQQGVRGLRPGAEEFLRAYGFVSVEDMLRRWSVLSTHHELRTLQQRLLANPMDAYALRQLKHYPISKEAFLRLRIPETPEQALRAIWSGDPMDITKINPLQRLYWHGVGGTQFNYVPGDFPMIFSHPLLGSVGMQFRRYAYQQATKVVAHVVEEAAEGNIFPLLYALAPIPTMGYAIKRLRNIVGQRDVVLVDGRPRLVEHPPIGSKGEALFMGQILSPEERAQLENAMSIGIMGLYLDSMMTLSQNKLLLLASWGVGVFPSEVFNLVAKMAQAGEEVLRGGERLPGKERFPKVGELGRQVVREVPFFGRFAAPHLRTGRARYEQLRDFAAAAFLSGDVRTFNDINRVLTERFYAPVTFDDVVMWGYRQHLRELGTDPIGLRPGDPGYAAYRRMQEREGRTRRRRPVSPSEFERARQEALRKKTEFFARLEEPE